MEIIRTESLSRHYAMGEATIHALRGIDLVVRRGEYVAIMGPSGCGKSTLMNLLGCLDTPDAGRYWLGGRLVSELSELELARVRNREIGFVFQAFALLPRQSRARERRDAARLRGRRPGRAASARARGARARRARRPRPPSADRAVRRPAPARCDSARARHRARSSCSPTSRPATSTARTGAEILALFDALHRAGNTLVLVTHERAVASARRANDRAARRSRRE